MYDATDFAADLALAAEAVLPWVGVAVAVGLAIGFAFMGIQAGVRFFRDIVALRLAEREIEVQRERIIGSMMSFGATREEASAHVDSLVDDHNSRITKEAGDRW